MNNRAKAASLAALINGRLGIEPKTSTGHTGQFDVIADGEKIVGRGGNWFTRKFGAGYPDFDEVVVLLEKHQTTAADL